MTTYLLLLILIFVLDLILGDPATLWHPVALFGRLASKVELLMRRIFKKPLIAGLVGTTLLTLIPAALLGTITVIIGELWTPGAWLVAALCGYFAVAMRSLNDHARRIYQPLIGGDLPMARQALSWIVSRDTATLSESEIVRGALESVSENLIDAVTSFWFWFTLGYLLGGAPGAVIGGVWLRCVNTLDACWGYRNERYELFGRVAARLDDVAHYIPARMTLLAIALAAPLVGGGGIGRTISIGRRDCRKHPSPNSGCAMAAFAGALDLQLGGETVYQGVAEAYPVWGDGRSKLVATDLSRGVRLAWFSNMVFILMMIVVAGGGLWLKEFI